MNALRVQLATLADGHSQLHFEVSPVDVGLEPEEWPASILLDAEVDRRGDQITLRGRLTTGTQEDCARCLNPFSYSLETEFTAIADRATKHSSGDAQEMDDYLIFHDGRVLELGELAREQAVLGRPMQSLCRPDCKGLCLGCGVNLNESSCQCGSDRAEGPPSAGSDTV
jgi:uncharacterized protein